MRACRWIPASAGMTASPAAKQGGLGLLNLFGDYLEDFFFPAL